MVRICHIHAQNPQQRLIDQAVDVLRDGGLVALPTDCCMVLACSVGDKAAMDRLRQVRAIDDKHLLTLICHNLSHLSLYARVNNAQYRFLKAATPGAYTFILEGSRELPRRILSPKRKTIGMRIPDHPVLIPLLETLGESVISSSLILPGEKEPLTDAEEIADRLGSRIDLVVTGGSVTTGVTTVLDLTSSPYQVVREGLGPLEPLGLMDD
jgi:tRNA threonylcarbamoyl adenosine modification protein (Sua5/YciO/YrdC/YwlC family)